MKDENLLIFDINILIFVVAIVFLLLRDLAAYCIYLLSKNETKAYFACGLFSFPFSRSHQFGAVGFSLLLPSPTITHV